MCLSCFSCTLHAFSYFLLLSALPYRVFRSSPGASFFTVYNFTMSHIPSLSPDSNDCKLHNSYDVQSCVLAAVCILIGAVKCFYGKVEAKKKTHCNHICLMFMLCETKRNDVNNWICIEAKLSLNFSKILY